MFHGTGHIGCGISIRVIFNKAQNFAKLSPVLFRSYSTSGYHKATIVDFFPELQDQNFNLQQELADMEKRLKQKQVKLAGFIAKADQFEASGQYAQAAAIHENVLIEGNSLNYFNSAIKAARLYRLADEPEKANKYAKMVETITNDGSVSQATYF